MKFTIKKTPEYYSIPVFFGGGGVFMLLLLGLFGCLVLGLFVCLLFGGFGFFFLFK